ncbi:MAG TPA: hypothetical protein PLV68_20050 [Ilumatobacteraceae bacterium]|nr:hypothetical protein [Ilumatobacteraceae bacterium]
MSISPSPGMVYAPRSVVPQGPRAFRYRIRRLGPLLSLLPALVLGVGAVVALQDNTSTTRGVGGFAAAVLAAPGLLAAGIPLTSGTGRLAAGIGASAIAWMVIGAIAARRATRSPVARWRDFWREWMWFALGVWIGVGGALLVAQLALGSLV